MTVVWGHGNRGTRSLGLNDKELNRPAMALDHGLCVHEAEADAVPFRRDEWVKDAIPDRRVDADAIVAYVEDDSRPARARTCDYSQRPSCRHGIGGIPEHIDEHLTEPIRVELDHGEFFTQLEVDRDLAVG